MSKRAGVIGKDGEKEAPGRNAFKMADESHDYANENEMSKLFSTFKRPIHEAISA